MLVIRESQLEVFRNHLEDDFRRRLCRRIRAAIPDNIMDAGQIETSVVAGIRQARDCGFEREKDIARFVEAICAYLGGFPGTGLPKPLLPILYAYRADPEIKLQRLI